MKRRGFIALLGGAAVWPLAARAQSRMPKIGVVLNYAETDPEAKIRFSALKEQLRKLGWADGDNVAIEIRWAAGKTDLMLAYASQFVTQPVDVIVANSTPLLGVLKQLTATVPIIFVQVADPVGSGFVSNYARPGGNITGFTDFDASIAGKWLEILKEVAPTIDRVTVLLDPGQANHPTFLRAIETAAPTFKLDVFTAAARSRAEIEQAIAPLAKEPHGGLVVLPGPANNTQRDLIIQLADRFHLPAVYPFKYYAKDGGLLYYGADQIDQWSKAAGYVDRVLRGEKPSELPIQAPTKYELIVNNNTARKLGLKVPATLLATADEVIE
jgi:putative tryptophan/tyrosine transport system substrate-binding protein